MSDNAKKPGTRDISDLKARLGLKKGGTDSRGAVPGGVPAPGAAKLGGAYVPPPPGVAPPPGKPPQPAIPDATVDPFGAMNAMAAHAAVQRAPEIIVVNDGKPVESVAKKSPLRFAKAAAMVLVPLILGFVIGGINYERKIVGLTIGDAEILKKDISDVGRKLQNLQNTLFSAKDRAGGKGYQLFDAQLVEEMGQVDLGIPTDDPSKFLIYHAHLFRMDQKLVSETLMFYTDMRRLQLLVQEHVRISKDDMGKAREDVIKKLGGETGLAAIIRTPPAKDGPPPPPLVEVVQLGAPICEDKQPHPEGCPGGAPAGFQFRSDTGVAWGSKEFAKDQVAVDRILLLGDSGVLRTLQKGSEKTMEEAGWVNRMREIDELTENLNLRRKDIENKMNTLAQQGKPFAI